VSPDGTAAKTIWTTMLLTAVATLLLQACGGDSGVAPLPPPPPAPRATQLAFLTQPGTAESQVALDPAQAMGSSSWLRVRACLRLPVPSSRCG